MYETLPVMKTSLLLTRRANNTISMMLTRLKNEVIVSFVMLFQDQGQFRDKLFQL